MTFLGHYCKFEHKIEHEYESPSIHVHHFDSMKDGPHLLILSGIHAGTERLPTAATYTVIDMLNNGTLPLNHGEVTIIPMCNPLALHQNKRYVDVNLNRVMAKHGKPTLYEHHLANIITGYIDRADAVIDLHTQSTPSVPFVFNDFPDVSTDLANALGIKIVITGWPEAFENKEDLFNEGDTARYAYENKKASVCVECGYNKDPMAVSTALKAMVMAMKFYALTDDVYANPRVHKTIRIKEGLPMPENAELYKAFSNFEAVKKGDPLLKAKDSGDVILTAPEDYLLVLPKIWAEAGTEAFFYGVEE